MKETDVTIISVNLNKKLTMAYKDYHVIEDDFDYEDLLKYKKVIFFNVLNNLKDEELDKLFNFIRENNILFINYTNNMELVLRTSYLMIYNGNDILAEGPTLEILKNDKLIKRLGFDEPFIVDLSLLLKGYGLISEIYSDKESLKRALWK